MLQWETFLLLLATYAYSVDLGCVNRKSGDQTKQERQEANIDFKD